MSEILDDLFYSESHEWIKEEDDGIYIVGITDYAQEELGDVVYVELPESETSVEQGSEFGSIESVKAVSELIAPVSGEIVEVNEELNTNPELINSDPYGKGWLIKIKINDKKELNNLLSSEEYSDLVSG